MSEEQKEKPSKPRKRRPRRSHAGRPHRKAGKGRRKGPLRAALANVPTPERLARAGDLGEVVDLKHIGAGRSARTETLRLFDQSPLDRLYAKGVVSDRQFQAGDQYRAFWHYSGLDVRVTTHYGERIAISEEKSALPATARQAEFRQRHRQAREALGQELAAVAQAILLEELPLVAAGRKLFGRRQAQQARASAIDTLKIALDVLGRFYDG